MHLSKSVLIFSHLMRTKKIFVLELVYLFENVISDTILSNFLLSHLGKVAYIAILLSGGYTIVALLPTSIAD